MSHQVTRYFEVMDRISRAREKGNFELEDKLVADLQALWDTMTDDEQREVESRADEPRRTA